MAIILYISIMIFAALIGVKNGLEENSIPYGISVYLIMMCCLLFIGYGLGDLLVSYYT